MDVVAFDPARSHSPAYADDVGSIGYVAVGDFKSGRVGINAEDLTEIGFDAPRADSQSSGDGAPA
jgi:hypothetical protein